MMQRREFIQQMGADTAGLTPGGRAGACAVVVSEFSEARRIARPANQLESRP